MNDQEIIKRERHKYACECDIKAELAQYGRPMHMAAKPDKPPAAPTGTTRSAQTWDAEAARRMLHNNVNSRSS